MQTNLDRIHERNDNAHLDAKYPSKGETRRESVEVCYPGNVQFCVRGEWSPAFHHLEVDTVEVGESPVNLWPAFEGSGFGEDLAIAAELLIQRREAA